MLLARVDLKQRMPGYLQINAFFRRCTRIAFFPFVSRPLAFNSSCNSATFNLSSFVGSNSLILHMQCDRVHVKEGKLLFGIW